MAYLLAITFLVAIPAMQVLAMPRQTEDTGPSTVKSEKEEGGAYEELLSMFEQKKAEEIAKENKRLEKMKSLFDEMEAKMKLAQFGEDDSTDKEEHQLTSDERAKQAYAANLEFIKKHNELYEKGRSTFSMGINKFSNLTLEEFSKHYKGYKPSNKKIVGAKFLPSNVRRNLPAEVDWRQHGYVTAVKNQEMCGSCWAFSVTGAIEGQNFRSTGSLVSLSEQNLVDCSGPPYENLGCNGGDQKQAFKYVIDNGGIDTEDSYPYKAVEGFCRYDPSNIGATISGIVSIPSGDENLLKEAVATVGPISVAIDANHPEFHLYKYGVFDIAGCVNEVEKLDHAVLVVGYGTTEDGVDYWLVKNSWDTDWGMDGYIMMSRNKNNQCGIATDASYPTV